MSDRPQLRLVQGDDPRAPSEPATSARDDEQPRAEALRSMHDLVQAAAAPPPLDEIDHEILLALTVGDDAAAFDADQLRRGAELAAALEAAERPAGGGRRNAEPPGAELAPLVELAESLRAASAPAELDEVTHERLLQGALGPSRQRQGRKRRAVSARGMVATVAAAAAAAALFWGTSSVVRETPGPVADPDSARTAPTRQVELIRSRSTQPLFDPAVPFPPQGGESARVDKIARARAAELRANRFAMWGVQ